ncbi:hypothetical protein [Pontibacter liquoris]|uniref:hypothetical protein n=1 Tax=Pontibacter liquoris TaxID=2905677 RepID=UPI001FA7B31A|nr:hypothetical protein [Pontibacter liquoris]
MEVYSDDHIRLTYTAEQSLLYAVWKEHKEYDAAAVKQAFMAIVATATEHKILNLMLNFANNTQNLTEAEYKSLIAQLALGLQHTSTQKIACIGPIDSPREQSILAAFNEIKTAIPLALDFRFYSNRASALQWLLT